MLTRLKQVGCKFISLAKFVAAIKLLLCFICHSKLCQKARRLDSLTEDTKHLTSIGGDLLVTLLTHYDRLKCGPWNPLVEAWPQCPEQGQSNLYCVYATLVRQTYSCTASLCSWAGQRFWATHLHWARAPSQLSYGTHSHSLHVLLTLASTQYRPEQNAFGQYSLYCIDTLRAVTPLK